MPRRVLHLISQRPAFTGSGVSLDAVVRCAARAGWEQEVICGVPPDDPYPEVGGLARAAIHPLVFESGELDFPLPGMSDVMPYASSRWSELSEPQLAAYRSAWCEHLAGVIERFAPDVIHTRHIWLLSSLVKDVAPGVPVVNHCHATGLRQMSLCPHLAQQVRRGCARNERFLVLHRAHAAELADKLGVGLDRIHIVATGYREDVFRWGAGRERGKSICYAGKYSHAKGLPWLLDAIERLARRRPGVVLHVAGDGAGPEAEALRRRMSAISPTVVMHGQLGQVELAELLTRCAVFVLPSMYEGLPLVVVEALASGCRVVCTDLPGVRDGLGDALGRLIARVPMPRLIGVDVPVSDDLPTFIDGLDRGLDSALRAGPLDADRPAIVAALEPFRWEAVFRRVEAVWAELAGV